MMDTNLKVVQNDEYDSIISQNTYSNNFFSKSIKNNVRIKKKYLNTFIRIFYKTAIS